MEHDQFMVQVQERGRLESRRAAETATRATLETLAERIPVAMADNLASELPQEIGEHLRRVPAAADAPPGGERFDRREFVSRVAARSGTDDSEADHEARVVMEVVGDAVSEGAMNKILALLPLDLTGLLTAGGTG